MIGTRGAILVQDGLKRLAEYQGYIHLNDNDNMTAKLTTNKNSERLQNTPIYRIKHHIKVLLLLPPVRFIKHITFVRHNTFTLTREVYYEHIRP